MRRTLRDRRLLFALCGLIPVAACSRLTSVDWSQIKPTETMGGTSPSPSAGDGGEVIGIGGQGEAGQGGSFDGGESGEGGVGAGGSAGTAGGGMAGTAGGGMAGVAGGGMAGVSGGGMGGVSGAGMGGSGGNPIVIIGGAGAIAQAVVLYDGGADAPNCDYGGREGLNARCASKKGDLPHSKTVAFISVSPEDELYDLPQSAQVPANKQIVSRTGVLLADNWVGLLGDGSGQVSGAPRVPLITAGVLPEGAKRWLSGTIKVGTVDLDNTCDGWTSSEYDPAYQARVGKGDLIIDPINPEISWLFGFKVGCNTTNNHVLCLAYDP